MITSQENVRIKEARKLHSRKHRMRAKRLLLEGVRLIADARRSGFQPELTFYDGESLLGEAAQSLLYDLAQNGVECIACSHAVFATLVDTMTPQGVAAVAPLPQVALPTKATFALVLDRVHEPGNAGALLRTAEAAGVDVVIFGPETVDPYNDKVVRSAMGAHFRLPLCICADWSAVSRTLPASARLYLADAHADIAYDAVDWRQPSALIVGGEAEGASLAARRAAQPIAIPMCGGAESLNAAAAGAVILFEAARQRRLTTAVQT
jgi:TrmH family RNA methyltransferase